jgi:hypothetical protein
MIDLTDYFVQANAHKSTWNEDTFIPLLKNIAATLQAKFDWDDGAGEYWAAVFNDILSARICTVAPIALIHERCFEKINDICKDKGLTTVMIEDFDNPIYSLDKNIAMEIFGYPEERFRDFDRPMSINDIWFYTI